MRVGGTNRELWSVKTISPSFLSEHTHTRSSPVAPQLIDCLMLIEGRPEWILLMEGESCWPDNKLQTCCRVIGQKRPWHWRSVCAFGIFYYSRDRNFWNSLSAPIIPKMRLMERCPYKWGLWMHVDIFHYRSCGIWLKNSRSVIRIDVCLSLVSGTAARQPICIYPR